MLSPESSAGSAALPVVTGGINLNASAMALYGATGSYELLGSSPGDWSIAPTWGPDATANVNVSGHGQVNLPPMYNLRC
jgi:hypothetical protein